MLMTQILVAVHGNGLTHTLWMSPGGYVFEMQPAGCTVVSRHHTISPPVARWRSGSLKKAVSRCDRG
jgi:hypothetical protein